MLDTYWASDKDGKLLSVKQVDRGLACDCICICCKSRVVANQGKKKRWYFSHHNKQECQFSGETALHFKAKDIIEKHGRIRIPSLSATGGGFIFEYPEVHVIKENPYIDFDEIWVEKYDGKIKPDLIGRKKDRLLYIEIAVTHFVDDQKLKKIKESGHSCLEINLSPLKNIEVSDEQLEDFIINRVDLKRWVYHRNLETAEKMAFQLRVKQDRKNHEDFLDRTTNRKLRSDYFKNATITIPKQTVESRSTGELILEGKATFIKDDDSELEFNISISCMPSEMWIVGSITVENSGPDITSYHASYAENLVNTHIEQGVISVVYR